ncbi:ABC transporter substrate-binding protein [Microbacterium rhizomatis]|uniref:ABC transporter substrate-binding protein n=1 Tax=Microbacterium rhizomatis TaxID=1631477 RepID=A0A5J5J1Q0_9MICO|nr:ABC transporter substrate-binding protein [Microbacterium rhizomatis]KAA9106027.1 ABC transporter substrate-binding protein [Microbacterium rhizomatis]
MRITRYPRTTITAAAIMAGALSLALAGCTSSNEPSPAPSLPAETIIQTPAASGEVESIVWALSAGEPLTLDPQSSADYSPKTVVSNLCESLMLINADGEVVPNLATSLTTPDPLSLVVSLRDDAVFWDGSPLTVDDVVYSLDRLIGPESVSAYAADFLSVASVAATGQNEVTLSLSVPDPLLPAKLASTGAAISQAAFVEQAGASYGSPNVGLMCSGPYKFTSWTPGSNIVIERSGTWWNSGVQPKVQSIRFDFVGDNDTLSTALLAGEIDGAYDVPTGSIPSLAGSNRGTLYRGESTISVLLGPTSPEGPGADPAFRAALNLAIDKQAISSLAAGGAGSPMASMISPFVWSGSPAEDVYDAGLAKLASGQDLEAAKAFLEKMKTPLDGPVRVAIIAGNQLMERAMTLVQADAAKIGVDIDIEQLQPLVYTSIYTDPAVREDYDLFASSGAFVEVPSPVYWASLFVSDWSPFNYAGYNDPAVTELMNAAALEPDPIAQAEMYVKAQEIFAVNGPIIGLTTLDELLFMNNRISGAPASSYYLNLPWAAYLGGTES